MLKPLPLTAALLMGMTACTGATDTPDQTETSVPTRIAETAAPPANTPTPEATSTPVATATPAATPTEAPAPRPTAEPTNTTAAAPTSIPEPRREGILTPFPALHPQTFPSELSNTELACLGDEVETLRRAISVPDAENQDEKLRLLDCLEKETTVRIFLAGTSPRTAPFSEETSSCVQTALTAIGPKAALAALIRAESETFTVVSYVARLVTIGCMNQQEWEASSIPGTTPGDEEWERNRCLVEEMGGPGPAASALTAAGTAEEMDEESAPFVAWERCLGGLAIAPPAQTMTAPTLTPGPAAATPAPSPTPAPGMTTPTTTLVITVAEVPAGIPEYDRSEWRHWVDADGDCQEARQEVLIAESLVEVTYEDDRQSRVATGRWWAPHLGHHLENPRHIDVDHHVPLKNAHISGGWRWSPESK